ncbi:MAG: SAM-dependent methyltransferase [Chlamydiales bacterium]
MSPSTSNAGSAEHRPDDAHKIYPKQFDRDDFWSQIKRTVNGKPVSEEDISMIVTQCADHLQLGAQDHLLDLGCGNAALASRTFDRIAGYTGVDFSSYLLEIANEYFKPDASVNYVENDAAGFVMNCPDPEAYHKLLCYGCMSYLSRGELLSLIETLHGRFPNLERAFFGNVPNTSKAPEFFAKRDVKDYDLDDPKSPIGVWWDPEELAGAASACGFTATVVHMPEQFYGAPYRFDLLLTRGGDDRA